MGRQPNLNQLRSLQLTLQMVGLNNSKNNWKEVCANLVVISRPRNGGRKSRNWWTGGRPRSATRGSKKYARSLRRNECIVNFPLIMGILTQSTSLAPSLRGCRAGRRTVFTLCARSSPKAIMAREPVPLYRWQRATYHPGLDYCLFCRCKSDVSTIETILYEYSLNL